MSELLPKSFSKLSLGLALLCFCTSVQAWVGKPVGEIRALGLSQEDQAALVSALGVGVGKLLDENRLDATLREMGNSGRWSHVLIESETEKGRLVVTLRGRRIRRIRNVDFQGPERGIISQLRARFQEERERSTDSEFFTSVQSATKEVYADHGYFVVDVRSSINPVSADEADVAVQVNAANPTRVSKLSVRGGSEQENKEMTALVPLQRGDIFSRAKLAEGVDRINAYLRANQYPTSRVADTFFQFSPDSREVAVVVQLKMGERFQIQFSGNSLFDDVQLRGLLTDDVLAQTDPSMRIAQLVESKYHAVGYPDTRVEVKKTLVESGSLNLIEMQVSEGERAVIQELRFATGNIVDGVNLSRLFYEVAPGVLARGLYWADGLNDAVVSMQQRLRAMGYLNSRISDPKASFSEDRKSVLLFFDSDLGVRTILTKVEFVGANHFSYADFEPEFTFEVGGPLNQEQVNETARQVLAFYASSGFPQAKLLKTPEASVEISRDQQTATVRYEIEEGLLFKIGNVQIDGLKKTKSVVVLREMDFQQGSKYSAKKIRQLEENLSLLGLFSRVEIIETPAPQPGVMDLRIAVQETRPGNGEVGFGGVYEDPRLRLRPFLGVTYGNVSGLNQTASVRADLSLPISRLNSDWQIPFVEYSTVLGYRYPFALSLPVTFATQVAFDRVEVRPAEQTLLTRARIEGRLEKKFSSRLTATYRLIRVERTRTESNRPLTNESAVPLTESIGSTGPGVILDFRDDIFNPRRGSFHSLEVEFAHPLLFSQGNIGFILALMRNSFYVPLGQSMGLALYVGLGYAHSLIAGQPIARARLVNELSLGGQGSIRGIEPRKLTSPDPLNTRNMFYYNARAEWNVRLFADFGLALFLDSGQIFPDFNPVRRADGVGIGLRYKTPVGPVVVDVAQGFGALAQSIRFYFTVGTL